MPASVRAVASATIDNNASSFVVAKPTGAVDGDFLLALVMQDSDCNITNLTGITGFSQVGADIVMSGTSPKGRFFGKFASSEGTNYTVNVSANSSGFCTVLAIPGVDPNSILHGQGLGVGTGTAETSPAVTDARIISGDLLVCAVGDQGGTSSHTVSGGTTKQSDPASAWCGGCVATQQIVGGASIASKGFTRAAAPTNNWRSVAIIIGGLPDVTDFFLNP